MEETPNAKHKLPVRIQQERFRSNLTPVPPLVPKLTGFIHTILAPIKYNSVDKSTRIHICDYRKLKKPLIANQGHVSKLC